MGRPDRPHRVRTPSSAPTASLGDSAGENISGTNLSSEPTGPNSTLQTNGSGDQLYPGPGYNLYVDRPPACTQTTPTLVPADCVPGIVRGELGQQPGSPHRHRHRRWWFEHHHVPHTRQRQPGPRR